MKQLCLNAVVNMNAKVRSNSGLDFMRFDIMCPVFPAVRPNNCIHKRC